MISSTTTTPVSINYNSEICVFINCPFDDAYLPLFNATVFATVCCGLIPVCSLAISDPSISRLDKLLALISKAKYSIHDLCRCHGQGDENFARLNMPLELGISIGLSSASKHYPVADTSMNNKWFLLVPNKIHEKAYQRFISDLQGCDPVSHGETQDTVVTAIMNIFSVVCELPISLTPALVLECLPLYEKKLSAYRSQWSSGQMPWPHTVKIALDVARTSGIIPEF
jgi:hypothetical protein